MSETALAEPRSKAVSKKKTLTPPERFAEWIYRSSRDGRIITPETCAKTIASLHNNKADVTDGIVRSWISKARIICEKEYSITLWNVRGRGWRVATPFEAAMYYVHSGRKTIAWAERTLNLRVIIDQRLIPHALRAVFHKAETGMRICAGTRKSVVDLVTELVTKGTEHDKEAPKQIEHKR